MVVMVKLLGLGVVATQVEIGVGALSMSPELVLLVAVSSRNSRRNFSC